MGLGMAVVGLAGILFYKRAVKKHGQTVERPVVIDKVENDTEKVVPSQDQDKSHPWHGESMEYDGVEEGDDAQGNRHHV